MVLGLAALATVLTAGIAPVAATAPADAPLAVRYAALLDDAAAALPADPGTARSDVVQAADLAGSGPALSPIVRALDAGDTARARLLLADEVAALHLPPGARGEDPAATVHSLDDVYARPPLDGLDRPQSKNPLDRLIGWIGDRLGSLPSGGRGPWTLLGSALALAAVAVVVARALRGVVGARSRRPEAGTVAPTTDAAAEWAAAERAAAAGDHREAIRRAYRSALLDVAVHGRLPVEPAWTTGDLLRRSAADPELRAALRTAAADFDAAWYGGRRPGAAEWAVARDHCAALRSLAGGRVPAATAGAAP